MNYLVIIPAMSMGSSVELKILTEGQIKNLKFYAEILTIFPLGEELTTKEKLSLNLFSRGSA